MHADGKVYVKLNKALYGCVESVKLWYDEISKKALSGMGFVANPQDPCVLNLLRKGHQVTICLYVDDLLITSVDEADTEWAVSELFARHDTVTLSKGGVHSYLGQTCDLSIDGEVHASMEGYLKDILDYCAVTSFSVTPATVDLCEINTDLPLLDQKAQDEFHSNVKRLMFLAQRARTDILTAVSFLSRRWSKAAEVDLGKLTQVLKYCTSTRISRWS
jgi:Reverse transcriptase (RNA-dependent DNA polymerase)